MSEPAISFFVCRVIANGVLLSEFITESLYGLIDPVNLALMQCTFEQDRATACDIGNRAQRINVDRILKKAFQVPKTTPFAVSDPKSIDDGFRLLHGCGHVLQRGIAAGVIAVR